MRKGCTLIVKKTWSKYSQWRSFPESKPVPCTYSFRKNNCPYMLFVWLICLNLILCFLLLPLYASTRTLSGYEVHLCQTNNNFVKQNKSSSSCLIWEGGVHPNTSLHIINTRVSWIPTLTNLAARRCTLSTVWLLYFWYGSQTERRHTP